MTPNTIFALCLILFVILIFIAFAFALTFSDRWPEYEEIQEREKIPHCDQSAHQQNDYTPAPSGPYDEAEAKRRQKQKVYRSSQARLINIAAGLNVLTAVAALAGFGALYILYKTLITTRIQAITAQQEVLISQRPYVTVGRSSDGRPADWEVDTEGNRTGLIIYFQNGGNTPAYQLYVNLLPTPGGLPDKNFAHLTMNWLNGDTLGAHSTLNKIVLYFAGKHIGDLLKGVKMRDGKVWQWSQRLEGNFEYLNVFGEYCCEPFTLSWENNQWSLGGAPAHITVCPTNVKNVCEKAGYNAEDSILNLIHQKSVYLAN